MPLPGLLLPDVELRVVDAQWQRLSPDEAATIEFSRGQMANFKVPKRVFFQSELPRNAMGKEQINLLRERYWESFA